MKISVSILNLDDKNELKNIENSNPDYIHIDVMDGEFVNNTSFPYNEIKGIVDGFNYDVHLMVKDVKEYIDDFKNINPKYITFHLETGNTFDIIEYIKEKKIKVGIAINPETDIEELIPYLSYIDLALVMSVEPGRGGQKFIMKTIDKIDKLYEYREEKNLDFKISVDGGINDETIKYVSKCDIVVSGSYVTNGDYEDKILKLRGLI